MWNPGYYEVVARLDERGVLEPPTPTILRLTAGQPITLVVPFWKYDPTLVPPTYVPYIMGAPYGLRWIAKRRVDDDDSAALWNSLGTFQTIVPYVADQVGRIDIGAPATQEAVDIAYTEIIVYRLANDEELLRIPLLLTLTRKGRTFADDQ